MMADYCLSIKRDTPDVDHKKLLRDVVYGKRKGFHSEASKNNLTTK